MARVHASIGSALDADFPEKPEDYTEWEIDDETWKRIEVLIQEDVGVCGKTEADDGA